MACQKVCKQGRDDAWKQRSTYCYEDAKWL